MLRGQMDHDMGLIINKDMCHESSADERFLDFSCRRSLYCVLYHNRLVSLDCPLPAQYNIMRYKLITVTDIAR